MGLPVTMLREAMLPLLGNWTGLEDQAASPWAPASQARAAITFKLDVADLVVVQDYRQVRDDGGEFTAHGVFLADPATGGISWWLFDSSGYPPVVATGGWAEGALTLTRTTPRGTAVHTFRVADARLAYEISLAEPGSSDFERFLTGAYRAVSGH